MIWLWKNIWHIFGGGAWNKDANPSIEKDLGIKEGYHYFKTKEERDRFLKLIKQDKYLIQGFRNITNDDIVIYTGYKEDELTDELKWLR